MRCVQLVSGLESRLGLFETRVDGSLSELQAKVTLMEGRLKFVERAPLAGAVASGSALSAASAPASPMKEPETTCVYTGRYTLLACLRATQTCGAGVRGDAVLSVAVLFA